MTACMTIATLVLLWTTAAQPAAQAQTNIQGVARLEAAAFLQKAAASDIFELETSRLALERSRTDSVRVFARMMMKDHTATMEKLSAAVASDGIAPPSSPLLDDAQRGHLRRLQEVTAADFDKAYLTQQRIAHEEALELYRRYAREGEGSALKAAAAEIGQVVERHLGHLREMGAR